ncbi:hypothetical protein G6F56_004979 [Rhizopus delemar]|nr:hypothetical protein G6F56_004979 [Rhizopus delemar]
MSRLQQLTITKPFNHRGIRKLIAYLKPNHHGLKLFVPACNFTKFYRRLTTKDSPILDHGITLLSIETQGDSSSSSDGEQSSLTKRDYDAYEVPYEVEKALIGIRKALMKPYIENGLAKLKRRRVYNPFYLDLLIKRNLVSKSSTYQLLFNKNSPPLDISCLLNKPIDIASIDNVIISAGRKFIESIVCFKDNWFFITQVDAFVRNAPDIDPCALDTKLIDYPETPAARIIQKSYKRSTWHEMVLLYGRFEFLVTGGIYGNIHDGCLKSFLGASLNVKTSIDEDEASPTIYILESPLSDNIYREERLLQNYSRRAACYKWGIRSTRFAIKGFGTLNSLYIDTIPLERAGSLILRCLAYNKFTTTDQEQLMGDIYAATVTYSIEIRRDTDDIVFLELLQQKCNVKFSVVVRAAVKLIKGLKDSHNPQTIMDGTLATSMFKDIASYRCTVIHNQKILNETFLL